MSGTEGITGGAGRTASGLSMMMGNAGKAIKQVVGNIDIGVMKPLVSRLYFYNMRYSDDPELKGDVNIVARGATLLIVKEQAQVRRNEFMNLALNNQTVNQIVGPEGVAALLREVVSTLDMKAGDIVPSRAAIRANQLQQQQMQQQQMQMMSMMEQPQPAMAPPGGVGNGQQLMNGAPMTDLYQPQSTS
jgi:hypothetical protein